MGNSGRAKLLGIYYGPQLSNTDRLQHLLADMQTRCSLWDHRARTLRGQVLILRQIILPILWFLDSVCHVPATGSQDQVNTLISRFLCKSMSMMALSKDWWFLPQNLGGLGLPSVKDMIHSLQVHMLCQANIGCPYTFSQRCSHLGRTGNSTIRPHHFPMGTGFRYPVCNRLNEPRLCQVSSLGQAWGLLVLCSLYREYASSEEAYAPSVKVR